MMNRVIIMIMKKNDCHEYPHRFKDANGWKPTDVCMTNIENFVKNEICVSKNCACECCSYRRQMYRAIQDIITNYKECIKILQNSYNKND